MQAIMNGKVYKHIISDWEVSRESYGEYRHWCYQYHKNNTKTLLVIMFNPGSLSGDGSNLTQDTTLRILREVCGQAQFNTWVINLFDYADPNAEGIFENWHKRDRENSPLIYEYLDKFPYDNYIFAYGGFGGEFQDQINARISMIKSLLPKDKEILLIKNQNGTPKHPIVWQRQKLKPSIIELLSTK